MLLTIQPASREPLFEQLVRGIRSQIAEGTLVTGERLPPARVLASSLDINVHTVLRAYQLLRDEGLIELRRGRGASVAAPAERGELPRLIEQLTDESRRLGVAPATVMAMMRQELER
ncbi:GntR family transcriptional regulator [Compostimonas suwonensis]|uniref:GntR family transcriptional regulator n=1 Tax=Compostimonas suwonensis TaxID=1048394 RepID=A0A2M9C0L5_9MICO|nr:GntR family transcriptional regulator [Compostimonas suwonensis]PJJ63886.1 GntR family transcriptional regulator [Compostimonas suwonensis]